MGQDDFLRDVVQKFESLAVPYMLVGSYASGIHGEARPTRDVDVVLDLPLFQVDVFCSLFPPPDYYVSPDAVRDAIRQRFQFNILHNGTGDKVDCIFPRRDEWGTSQLSRRIRIRLNTGLESYVASPVDVIVGKLWYFQEGGSEKHLRDIVSMLKESGDTFDIKDVTRWALKLGYSTTWQRCLDRWKTPQTAKDS